MTLARLHLRPATTADLPIMAEIYIDAVCSLAPTAYSPEQVAAWSSWPRVEPEAFQSRLDREHTWVAEYDGVIAAFAQFVAPDHLDFLYTRGHYAGKGLARTLHERLEGIARASGAAILRTEASLLSRPVFRKFGYRVQSIEQVERLGQSFRRFRMQKRLQLGPPATEPARLVNADYEPFFAIAPETEAGESVRFEAHDLNHPGWFSGHDSRGVYGYFPTVWFNFDDPASPTARCDYAAAELAVKSGESVWPVVHEGNWSLVVAADGREGWIPRSHLGPPQAFAQINP